MLKSLTQVLMSSKSLRSTVRCLHLLYCKRIAQEDLCTIQTDRRPSSKWGTKYAKKFTKLSTGSEVLAQSTKEGANSQNQHQTNNRRRSRKISKIDELSFDTTDTLSKLLKLLRFICKRKNLNIDSYNKNANCGTLTKKRSTTVVSNYKFRSLIQKGEEVASSTTDIESLTQKLDTMLGPEDLTHKEFELRYKQFVNVNDGIINKNVKTMPKNRQESFKMQKEHYDFIENKIVEKEELREAEHMDLMNRRTKKLQNRNKSQSKPKYYTKQKLDCKEEFSFEK